MNEIQDIQYEEITEQQGFLYHRYKPQGFIFRLSRELWSIEANGKKWQELAYYITFWAILIWIAIAIDIIILATYGIGYLLYFAVKELLKFLGKLIEKLFFKVILPVLQKAIWLTIIIAIAIIVIYRFTVIKQFILNLFDTALK